MSALIYGVAAFILGFIVAHGLAIRAIKDHCEIVASMRRENDMLIKLKCPEGFRLIMDEMAVAEAALQEIKGVTQDWAVREIVARAFAEIVALRKRQVGE
jgi:hypothetical protein